MQANLSLATFGGGCFWCIESIFNRLKGVESASSGFAGGENKNPSYEEVCNGQTGHVEVVQIKFDSNIISFHDLLKVFFKIHDPTQFNRQGEDIGEQYRSVIFYHNEEQKEISEAIISNLEENKIWDQPIVTAIEPIKHFYSAEEYHQNYYNLNKEKNTYCSIVISPKIEKFENAFKAFLK